MRSFCQKQQRHRPWQLQRQQPVWRGLRLLCLILYTGQYFKSIYGFYPDEKGWLKNVQDHDQTLQSWPSPSGLGYRATGALLSALKEAGVVVGGVVYHILGRAELPDKEDVSVIEIDAGNIIDELLAENKLLKVQVEALSQTHDFHEELIVELAEIVYA